LTPLVVPTGPRPVPKGRIAFVASATPLATESRARLMARYGDCPLDQAALVVSLGGDGFMLETLHRLLGKNVPVYGMNCGSVGFLMNPFSEDDLPGRLARAQEAVLRPLHMRAVTATGAVREALALGAGTAVAAWNAPDEVVVSGPEASLRAITANLPARRLPVAGAWHGPLMAGAVEELRAALERLPRSTPSARMIGDDGDVVPPDVVPDRLAEALVRPVRFGRALATLGALGVDVFVTVGPGAVLRGLVRKNLGSSARVLTTEDAADLGRTLAALQSAS